MTSTIMPTSFGTPASRMKEEGDQLAKRLAKLNAFVGTEGFKALHPIDAHMLTLQAEVMQSYLHILSIRLALMENRVTPEPTRDNDANG